MPAPPRQPFRFRLEFPPELPISVRAEELVATIQQHPVVILAGETGSGKTTQIPKMCLAAGRGVAGRIACTQPRRVAALSVSRRVAEELGVTWGREVGCKIRFNDQTTSATVIKFLTDGMLLAEVQGDPLLREYDTIIIDEAHERSLNIDFLLGHLRTLRFKRPELKIIITSATIDTEMFSRAFDDAPVVQVSGRTFPVEVIYAPLDALGSDEAEGDERTAKAEALHYIDGAVEAVERIIHESADGDILVFMPSERDIRETADLLEGGQSKIRNQKSKIEVVPLFGRLTNAEQQRVFAATQARKIIVATNIAETSLTIPGIRFVVDTGMARISRYAAQARTRRLPIEPIAQSSADQRKGRSGRVADGVCIRLYSERDFLERPRFMQPEIQRANLADVILRLKAFGLGDIERFPFINMPAAKSIRAGYTLLEELGAIEDAGDAAPSPRLEAGEISLERRGSETPPYTHQLTPVGVELARLPVDPTVGRMILQARTEKALREVLVIAAGLSIQDPRERPLEKQAAADAAHRRFAHPDSDFLTLFNIWETYHEEFENLSQAKLRRFCRDHFLSYTRMREWRDIHTQLAEVVRERGEKKPSSAFAGLKEVDAKAMAFGTPPYRAIHRSILAGLLGNIAQLDEEKGGYKATHDRRVNLFPGSVLFRREEPKRRGSDAGQRSAQKKDLKSPRWLMAAEIMETTRLYARTCARLDPAWALELGAHIVRTAHSEPFWDAEKAHVLVKRRSRLYGLELEMRAVSFGRVNPVQSTEIFIREALVNDTLTWPFDFLAHNRAVRREVESLLTRSRDRGYLNLDEAVFRFYAARLIGEAGGRARSPSGPEHKADKASRAEVGHYQGVSSVAELVDLVRERKAAEPHFLEMTPEDLRAEEMPVPDAAAFPENLPLDNRALPLNYAYKPGGTDDGVTLDVQVWEAEALTAAALDWAVPGHLEAKVEHYLRALPKELRRAFVPLAATAQQVAGQLTQRDRLTGRRENLVTALAAQLRETHRVAIDPALWAGKPLPDYLRVRVRVLDDEGRELAASRELAEIQAVLARHRQEMSASVAREEPAAWRRARTQWEKADQTEWTFGDVPAEVLVTEQAGMPVLAYPGLIAGERGVTLRLCKTSDEAQAATPGGLAALLALQLRYDLGWLERDLKALRDLGPLVATLAPVATLQAQALESIRRWACDPVRCRAGFPNPAVSGAISERRGAETPPYSLTATAFAAALAGAKADLRGLVPRFVDLLREILELRQALLVQPQPYEGLERDVAVLVPADFLAQTPHSQLAHLPRYLKGLKLRAERWRQNPAKDAERARLVARYVQALARPGAAGLRWLVEEFRVSIFAQELGTAEPVSTVKLDRLFAEAGAAPARPASEPAPVRPLTTAPAGKSAPLKSLGALDRLFKK